MLRGDDGKQSNPAGCGKTSPRAVPDAVREMLDPDSSAATRAAAGIDRGISVGRQASVEPVKPAAISHPAPVHVKAAVETRKQARKVQAKSAPKSHPVESSAKAPPPVAPLWSSPDR